MRAPDPRYREFLEACVREYSRHHTREEVAAAAAFLAQPRDPRQPELDLQGRGHGAHPHHQA